MLSPIERPNPALIASIYGFIPVFARVKREAYIVVEKTEENPPSALIKNGKIKLSSSIPKKSVICFGATFASNIK